MAITLYRVLAGRPPFHHAHGKPIYAWFHHHANVDPTLLADAAGEADIPPAIARVIESALAKDPADRPQTMLAFAEALQAAATTSTPASRPLFHHWPVGIVLVYAVLLLFAWRMTAVSAEAPHAGKTRQAVHPAANVATEPPAPTVPRTQPDAPAPDSSTQPEQSSPTTPPTAEQSTPTTDVPEQPVTRRPDPIATTRRALDRRVQAVQACADGEIDKIERLAATVNIDTDGRVSAHIDGAADTPLSRCIAQALQHSMASPPPRPQSFVHVFKLRATSRQP
jgi:serine/threonine protein kinase